MINILLIALYVIFAVGGSTVIKYGSMVKDAVLFSVPIVNVSVSLLSFAGIALYGLSFVFYVLLLSKFELSFISPLTIGIVYVLLMITAALFFNEQFTILKTIGCALILAGVLLIAAGK